MQGNPNIAENLSKIQTERSNLQNLLSKTLRELRENSFSTLTTTLPSARSMLPCITSPWLEESALTTAPTCSAHTVQWAEGGDPECAAM